MAYLITNEDSTIGRDPNINIINGIHNIKEKISVNIFSIKLHKQTHYIQQEEYVGCLEPAIEDSVNSDSPSHAQQVTYSTNSITTQRMMADQVKPNTLHHLTIN